MKTSPPLVESDFPVLIVSRQQLVRTETESTAMLTDTADQVKDVSGIPISNQHWPC